MFLAPVLLAIALQPFMSADVSPATAASSATGQDPPPPAPSPGAEDARPATQPPRGGRHPVPASLTDETMTIALRWENDVLWGTDGNYSNGVSLAVVNDGGGLLGGIWGKRRANGGRLIASYEIGQLMMTPADITRPVPDPADRPYAGLLYGAVSTQLAHDSRFDGLKLIAGVVGPASLAAETQKLVHRLTGSAMPRGWDHQLKNELILNAVYEHRRRYDLHQTPSGWGIEAIPLAGAMLGNMLTQAQAKAQLRFGYNLPDDFGNTQMRGLGTLPFPLPRSGAASRSFGAYGYAGAGGTLVARNLSLDGNTFREGPRVAKKALFPGVEFGVSVWTRWFEATVSYVVWGREYDTQIEPTRFGGATLAYRF